MMWTSEEILQATIDVFMDEYGATLVDLGPTGMDIDLSISAAVVAYEAGPTPTMSKPRSGSPGGLSKPLQTRPETGHPSP